MIPAERNSTMLVTMTDGDLYTLVKKAADEAAQNAVTQILDTLLAADRSKQDTELVIGGKNIANTLGIDRSTLYKLRREGRLGNSITYIGSKLVARKSDLYNAITNPKGQQRD